MAGRSRRVPFVQQLTAADCGAACLAMALRHHGNPVRLEVLREELAADPDGSSALGLLRVAEAHGLRGRGIKVDVDDLHYLPRGSILHWEFNHFVVFDRCVRDGVEIVDPATGHLHSRSETVRRSFTGVALVLEPTRRFQPARAGRSRLWPFLRHAAAPSGLWGRVLATSVLLQIFALAVPIATGLLVDRIVPRGDVHLLAVVGAGLLTLVAFQFLAALIRAHLLVYLRTNMDSRLTSGFLEHLVSLPYAFFQRRSAGDLLMRLTSNAIIRELLTSAALSAILDGILVVLALAILMAADPPIGLLVVVLGAAQGAVFTATRGRQRRLMVEGLQAQARVQSYEFELLAGIETLKALGAERRAIQRWSDLFVDGLNVSVDRGRLQAAVDAVLSALRLASPLLVLGAGTLRVFAGDMSLGTMLALTALSSGVLLPLSTLVTTALQLQLLGTYFERIDDVLQSAPEQDAAALRPAGTLRGTIGIDRLTFTYPGRSAPAVREVSADIAPGQHVAIVGRSGAGKSTLASLLVGLYPPASGRILYDGVDLATLDLPSVRRQIGIVTQRPYLFGASVRANITLADPSVPLDVVVEAATLARIHDDIAAMPMGYETFLADGGASLAGGQRQRIAIARALVRRPAILLLDEATSALDAVTEAEVHAGLDTLRCTRIVIAHRLSTIMRADVILVMDEGRIVEHGTHRELVARGGTYAALVQAQTGRSLELR